MKERPILFSAPMVRAILAGTKTVTRRIINPQPTTDDIDNAGDNETIIDMATGRTIRCPYGSDGGRLWVRETHAQFVVGEGLDTPVPQNVAYRATCDSDGGFDYVNGRGEPMRLKVTKWTPSIFMPRWASRITLKVVSVRVERLHAITREDAIAEGVELGVPIPTIVNGEKADVTYFDPIVAFAHLWCSVNGPDAWKANPLVWVVEFKRILDEQARAA